VAGVPDVTVALPRLVGGDGVLDTFMQPLSGEEEQALARSAKVVRDAIGSLGY
jgi:L-lactate dehydrogenase